MDTELVAAKTPPEPYFSIRTLVQAPGVVPVHQHSHFEVLLQLTGRRTQHLSIRDVAVEDGCLVCIGPGITHGATVHGEGVSLLIGFNLRFLCPELPASAAAAWSRPIVFETAPGLLPFAAQSQLDYRCSPQLTAELQDIATALMSNTASQRIGAHAYLRAQLSLFLLTVVRNFEDGLVATACSKVVSEYGSDIVDEVIDFIRQRLSEPLSIEAAAQHLSMSPSCLAARLRRVTGKSFGDLLLEARMTRAKELLLYREDRISDIAYASGFDDHTYFCRRFRQFIGVTPSEFRKARAQQAPSLIQAGRHGDILTLETDSR